MSYDSTQDTKQHIFRVQSLLFEIINELSNRAFAHDESKLHAPEKELLDIYTPKLKDCTYGSLEYHAYLEALKPALDNHYKKNSHHPEHHKNGIYDMNLLDVLEMFCDWKAATERHADGSLEKSIEINEKRFSISPQLKSILIRTKIDMGW